MAIAEYNCSFYFTISVWILMYAWSLKWSYPPPYLTEGMRCFMFIFGLALSSRHNKEITFYLMISPHVPVLDLPWLLKHNPEIDWVQGIIKGWVPTCASTLWPTTQIPFHLLRRRPPMYPMSLLSITTCILCSVSPEPAPYPLIGHMTAPSICIRAPRTLGGRLLSLSTPETQAMEKYIIESLATGLICPSSSPAGAGFFMWTKSIKPSDHALTTGGLTST